MTINQFYESIGTTRYVLPRKAKNKGTSLFRPPSPDSDDSDSDAFQSNSKKKLKLVAETTTTTLQKNCISIMSDDDDDSSTTISSSKAANKNEGGATSTIGKMRDGVTGFFNRTILGKDKVEATNNFVDDSTATME